MTVHCPHCSTELEAPEELRERIDECPHCGKGFFIPADSPPLGEVAEDDASPSPLDRVLVLVLALCLISCHSHDRHPAAVTGWSPLERAVSLNSRDARAARLKIGWAVFASADAWHTSAACRDKRWRWKARDAQTAEQKKLYAYAADAKPSPRDVPFAVLAIEHLAIRQSRATAPPKLIISGHGEGFCPSASNSVTGILVDPPVGYDRRAEQLGILAYTLVDNTPVAVYRRDVPVRHLWFLTGPDARARHFRLLIDPYPPISFTVPEMPPIQ